MCIRDRSKAWGLAGLRLGMAFAGEPIINYFNKVKYPYNINTATQQLAIEALGNISSVNNWTKTTVEQKESLKEELLKLPFIQNVFPSDANFILVKMKAASKIYEYLTGKGIIVRDRSKVILCDDSLAQVAIDFGGRNWLVWQADFKREKIGDMPTEMFYHFFKSFSDAAKCNLNIKAEGDNEHHKIESIFKALAKSIKMAVKRDADNMQLPSTKGCLLYTSNHSAKRCCH